MNYYVHPQAMVETTHIGDETKIWAFAHILPKAKIGAQCNICDHVFIENDVIVGNHVTIKNGVQLWDGIRIEDNVFIGPNVTFTNDRFPRSKQHLEKHPITTVKEGASIGANATILPGLTIGKNAMIGAGAVVLRDVPPNAIAIGNPAYIKGYVNQSAIKQPTRLELRNKETPDIIQSSVKGVRIYNMPVIHDMRGNLSVGEYGQYLPFIPKRYFLVFDVKSKELRGEHAHKTLHQFLICVKGSCSVVVDDGVSSEEVVLDSPCIAIYIPPMVWGIQYKYTKDALLLVLASDVYKAEDYIRDYDEFITMIKAKG